MIITQIIFWVCLFLVCYTYLLFPLILKILAGSRELKVRFYKDEELPAISVLISAHNEEKMIGQKIESVMACKYPVDKLEVLVGSDASSDQTNVILEQKAHSWPALQLFFYQERQGKPRIINQLAEKAAGEILVISDANVLLESDTLMELIRYFKEERIGLVDSRLIGTGIKEDGISRQEKFYTSREVTIKYHESLLWESMMGPFGGCYAVRKSCYNPVPDHYLVDDFYINMSVLEQGRSCISNLRARVSEDVSNDPREEFRRKRRISSGNFQNLARFSSLLFKGKRGVAFCFFSHKLLRWLVPFLVLVSLALSASLATKSSFYLLLLLLQLLVLIIPVIEQILRKIGIQNLPLRFISHFVLMNMAILAGFFKFAGGIKNNVWEPPSRNQD
jgi:cellulose synthase/poly-beta-1,6-N-acetylglucosamine synthase-like glycosyltransferase